MCVNLISQISYARVHNGVVLLFVYHDYGCSLDMKGHVDLYFNLTNCSKHLFKPTCSS